MRGLFTVLGIIAVVVLLGLALLPVVEGLLFAATFTNPQGWILDIECEADNEHFKRNCSSEFELIDTSSTHFKTYIHGLEMVSFLDDAWVVRDKQDTCYYYLIEVGNPLLLRSFYDECRGFSKGGKDHVADGERAFLQDRLTAICKPCPL